MAVFHLEASLTAVAKAVSIAERFHNADIAPPRESVSGITQVSVSSADLASLTHWTDLRCVICHNTLEGFLSCRQAKSSPL